ncbi:MAG: hypothetical protein F6J92_32240 [Symploca sp. SIO1A3]|nr:hypothetical protein [Symploca sp. SIO1A3]
MFRIKLSQMDDAGRNKHDGGSAQLEQLKEFVKVKGLSSHQIPKKENLEEKEARKKEATEIRECIAKERYYWISG